MIYDRLDNLTNYLRKELHQPVLNFLSRVRELPPGRYEVAGEAAYAKVHEYATSEPEDCKIEAHDKYIDIQATLTGAEGITVYARERLQIKAPYNPDKDAMYFEPDTKAQRAHVDNLPGWFTWLEPQEAHRPQENVEGYGKVRKFVIKVRV